MQSTPPDKSDSNNIRNLNDSSSSTLVDTSTTSDSQHKDLEIVESRQDTTDNINLQSWMHMCMKFDRSTKVIEDSGKGIVQELAYSWLKA